MIHRLVLALCLLFPIAALFSQGNDMSGIVPAPTFDTAKMVASNVVALQAGHSKIDVLLRNLLEDLQARRKGGPQLNRTAIGALSLIAVEERQGEMYVDVFIKTDGVHGVASAIASSGGRIATVAGDILTANLPVSSIESIASRSDVLSIQPALLSEPLHNVSRREIRADDVHAGTGLPRAYTGKNVVVGIVDSGLDEGHPDFWTPGGSRIQYLWDMSDSQSAATAPPPEYGYGREWTKEQIDFGLCMEGDYDDGHGHGTHVAGSAAGNGNTLAEYAGMAPEADIIFVKGFRDTPGFASTDVVNGCAYIFNRAQRLGKPAVINLSLGGHLGSHDGKSLYEQSLRNLVGPGKLIVAAAGNEGEMRLHVRYTTGGNATEPRVTFWKMQQGAPFALIDVWHTGSVAFGIATYDDYPWLMEYTAAVLPGKKLFPTLLRYRGLPFASVEIDHTTMSDPTNGSGRATIAVMVDPEANVDLSSITFALYTFGSGTLDGWFVRGGEFSDYSLPDAHIMPGDYLSSCGIPGTAEKLITVGSYVTKNQWIDFSGVIQTQEGCTLGSIPAIGDISCWSSRGPTRDGRLKPEISAPGEVILSAFSQDLRATTPDKVLFGGGYQKMEGTSMAAPHVTGVVALLLEKNPDLDYPDVLNILTGSARMDAYTKTVPNQSFGYGKIDALAAVQRVTPKHGMPAADATSWAFSSHPNPFSETASITYTLPASGRISLRLYDVLGREMKQLFDGEQGSGTYTIPLDAAGLTSGIYFVKLAAAASTKTIKLVHHDREQ